MTMTTTQKPASIKASLRSLGRRRAKKIKQIEERRLNAYTDLNTELVELVSMAREAGLEWAQISRETGLSRQTLNTVIRRHRGES